MLVESFCRFCCAMRLLIVMHEEGHSLADVAAPQVKAVELHRLCFDESERQKVLFGCECEKGAYCGTDYHLVCM